MELKYQFLLGYATEVNDPEYMLEVNDDGD